VRQNSVPIFQQMYLRVVLVVFAISSQPSFAQNQLGDLLKNAVNKAAQQMQQKPSAGPPPSNTQQSQTNPSNRVTDSENKQAAPVAEISGGKGPDIVGMRVGMGPQQARAVFKMRGFGSNALPNTYFEAHMTLAVRAAGGQLQAVTNGAYVERIRAFTRNGQIGADQHIMTVRFAPIPTEQEVVSIYANNSFSTDKRPTFGTFRNALIEKYGTPTLSNDISKDVGPERFEWSFDADGKLRKPGSIKFGDCIAIAAIDGLDNTNDWVLTILPSIPENEKLPARCGSFLVSVVLLSDMNPSPNSLVFGQAANIVGIDAALRALHAARAIIGKAQGEVNGAAIMRGRQQKPDL